ncbi:10910_t:CDS:2, partial [Gigaspora margarita]
MHRQVVNGKGIWNFKGLEDPFGEIMKFRMKNNDSKNEWAEKKESANERIGKRTLAQYSNGPEREYVPDNRMVNGEDPKDYSRKNDHSNDDDKGIIACEMNNSRGEKDNDGV